MVGRTQFLSLLFFISLSLSLSSPAFSANNLTIAVAEPATLDICPSLPVEKSPGAKPGYVVLCERVQILGLSRLKNLEKFAHSMKVKVSNASSATRLPNIEACFHRNMSLGIGMCPQGQWEKVVKGSWVWSMSPYDNKLLDIRVAGSSAPVMKVSIAEEFVLYRVIFFAVGISLMLLASTLSKSLVFYYSSAMAVGIILVILVVLFQGMKLLPTGRKSSFAIFVYSSLVGLGSLLLGYVPRLFRSILTELGISEDLYDPLALFLVVFLALTGAWLGFWAVRKLILTEDGLIDVGVSSFVAWSIRVIAAIMILQSSEDLLLAAEALLSIVVISSLFRQIIRARFVRHFRKYLLRRGKRSKNRHQSPVSSPLYSHSEYVGNTWTPETPRPFTMTPHPTSVQGIIRTPPSQPSDSETFYSSHHKTLQRRKFSNEEWESFTKDSTKKALEELVSTPDFSKWAVARADRITLSPPTSKVTRQHRSRWLPWS